MKDKRKETIDALTALKAGDASVEEVLRQLETFTVTDNERYEIIEEVGRGGVGAVYLARDNRFDREIAIKKLLPQNAEIPSTTASHHAERFLREATVTGQLEHPNIVPVYEISEEDGAVFYTMKFVRGRSLEECLDEIKEDESLNEAAKAEKRLEYLDAFIDLCNAVAFAHSKRVIHRDLKPANLMLGDFGETLLVDWGLAAYLDEELTAHVSVTKIIDAGDKGVIDSRLTQQGSILGTPAFMAPEQARGDLAFVNQKSDIFALGAILHEILSGQPPIAGDTLMQVLSNAGRANYRDLKETAPDAPPELVAVASYGMAKEPDDRPSSAAELAEAVTAWRDGGRVDVYDYSGWELTKRFAKRNRAVLTSALVALVVLAAVLVYAFAEIRDEADFAQNMAMKATQSLTKVANAEREAHLQAERAIESEAETKVLLAKSNALTSQVFHTESERLKKEGRYTSAALYEIGRLDYQENADWQWNVGTSLQVLPRLWHTNKGAAGAWNLHAWQDRFGVVARAKGKEVTLYDYGTGRALRRFEALESEISNLDFHPTELRLAVAGSSGEVVIWDLLAQKIDVKIGGHQGRFRSLLFCDDGKALVALSRGRVELYDSTSGEAFELPLEEKVNPVLFLPTHRGTRIVLVEIIREPSSKIRFSEFDSKTLKVLRRSELVPYGLQMNLSRNLRRFVFQDDEKRLKVFDIESFSYVLDLASKDCRADGFLLGDLGRRLVLVEAASNTLQTYEVDSGKLLFSCALPAGITLYGGERVLGDNLIFNSFRSCISLQSGELLRAPALLEGLKGATRGLSSQLSGDGQSLLYGLTNGDIERRSALDDTLIETLSSGSEAQGAFRLHPSEESVFCYDPGGKVVWKTLKGDEKLGEFKAALAFHQVNPSPDGCFLLVPQANGAFTLVDLRDQSVWRLPNKRDTRRVAEACFSRDGKAFATGSTLGHVTIHAVLGRDRYQLSPSVRSPAIPLAFLSDDKELLVYHTNGELILWDLVSNTSSWRATTPLRDWLFGNEGRVGRDSLFVFDREKDARGMIRLQGQAEMTRFESNDLPFGSPTLSPDQRLMYRYRNNDSSAWQVANPEEGAFWQSDQVELRGYANARRRSMLLKRSVDEGLELWVNKGSNEKLLSPFKGELRELGFLDGQRAMFLASSVENRLFVKEHHRDFEGLELAESWSLPVRQSENIAPIMLFQTRRGFVMKTLGGKEPLRRFDGIRSANGLFDLSSDQAYFAAATNDGRIQIWNAADAKKTKQIRTFALTIEDMHFRPGHREIVSRGPKDLLLVHDVESGEMVRVINLPPDSSTRFMLSPDGRFAATAQKHGRVFLWNLETGQEHRRLVGHDKEVSDFAFTNDSTKLVTVSEDKTTRLWDINFLRTSVVPQVMGNARVLKALIQRQLGQRLKGPELVPLRRREQLVWITPDGKAPKGQDQEAPKALDDEIDESNDNKFGMKLSEDELALIAAFDAERQEANRRRIEEYAKQWEARYEGYRYVEKDGKREYLPARAKDPLSGEYLGEAKGEIDHGKWFDEDVKRKRDLRTGGHTIEEVLKLSKEKLNTLSKRSGNETWSMVLAALPDEVLTAFFKAQADSIENPTPQQSAEIEKQLQGQISSLRAYRRSPLFSPFRAELATRNFVEKAWAMGLFDDE